MKSRRKAREAVLQALYQCDSLDDWSDESIDLYFSTYHTEPPTEDHDKENLEFARAIVKGVVQNLSFLDTHLSAASTHWSVARMSRIDRNILRMASFEIGFVAEVPISVSINEAIEISKSYGGDESPMFINGVLDNLAKSFVENKKLNLITPQKERKKLVVNE